MTITATITDHQGLSTTLNMFHINLKIQEGEYAHLKILAKRQDIQNHDITLCHNEQIIFKGILIGAPHYIEPELMELLYLARPRGNTQKHLSTSYFKNMNPAPWALPYVDPVHGTESTISMLPTHHGTDIHDHILEDSMKLEQMRLPLSSIRVIVKAKWIQKGSGNINLLPFIKKTFPNQRIATLTGKTLAEALPHMGQTLGPSSGKKTGYTVLSATLKPVRGLTDTVVPIMINGKKHHLPVQEYTGHFWLQWQCAFSHEEEVRFLLKWENGAYHCTPDDPSHTAGNELEYIIDPCHIAQEYDHFFVSETGKLALQQAAEQSLFKGLQSQQSHMLSVKVPFHVGVKLCVGASVQLPHKTGVGIEHGTYGRIMGLSSIFHANDAHTLVKIAFSKGAINLQNALDDVSSITQRLKLLEGRPQNFTNVNAIPPEALIKHMRLMNSLDDQIAIIQGIDFKTQNEVASALKNHMTEIYFELADLSNKAPCIKRYGIQ